MNQATPAVAVPAGPALPQCLLTLALPLALQDEVLDLLREQHDLVPGFSVVSGHGMGEYASLTSMMERVEGRARRVLVYMVMRVDDVPVLVERLRSCFQSPEVFYWAVPLLLSGRFV